MSRNRRYVCSLLSLKKKKKKSQRKSHATLILILPAAVIPNLGFIWESPDELVKNKDLRICKNQNLRTETREPYFMAALWPEILKMTLKTSSPSPLSSRWENWSWETVYPPPIAAPWQSEPLLTRALSTPWTIFLWSWHSWSQHLHPHDVSQVYHASFQCPYTLYLPSWAPSFFIYRPRALIAGLKEEIHK